MGPDYQTNDPKGWNGDPKRGAALGRPPVLDAPADFAGRVYLRRVRLDSGGYDSNGTYFGFGEPLYWYATADLLIDATLRALSRSVARERVLNHYPRAQVRR